MANTASQPQSKASQVRALMDAGEWEKAISLAARFPQLGRQRAAILDAHAAYTNVRFIQQLGKDAEALKAGGQRALIERFGQ